MRKVCLGLIVVGLFCWSCEAPVEVWDGAPEHSEEALAIAASCPDPDDDNVEYVSWDRHECHVMLWFCDGGQHFYSKCGCGCIFDTPPADLKSCSDEECGPMPMAPVILCDDGSLGGNIGLCERDEGGQCGWVIRDCPEKTDLKPTMLRR